MMRFQVTIPAKTTFAWRTGRIRLEIAHPNAISRTKTLANIRPATGPMDMNRCISGLSSVAPSCNAITVVAASATCKAKKTIKILAIGYRRGAKNSYRLIQRKIDTHHAYINAIVQARNPQSCQWLTEARGRISAVRLH
jgi:hypothetical protein